MFIHLVRHSLDVAQIYGAIGLLFAVAFHARGLRKMDAGAHATSFAFRLLITPGIAAFWPLLALRWWRTERGQLRQETPDSAAPPKHLRKAHGLVWKLLCVGMPILLGILLASRPVDPSTGDPSGVLPSSSTASGLADFTVPSHPLRTQSENTH